MTPPPFLQAASVARVAATGLKLGRSIDFWSLALMLLAMACLWAAQPTGLGPQLWLLLVIIAGVAEKALALRVAFDASLFASWAESWASGADSSRIHADLAAFDQALATCGLRTAPAEVRNLDARIAGAFRLLRRQSAMLATQLLAWLAALVTAGLPPGI